MTDPSHNAPTDPALYIVAPVGEYGTRSLVRAWSMHRSARAAERNRRTAERRTGRAYAVMPYVAHHVVFETEVSS